MTARPILLVASLLLSACVSELAAESEAARAGDPQPLGSSPWSSDGLFVWHPSAFPAEVFAARVRDGGFTWITVQVHDGTSTVAETEAELGRGWADAWRAAGVRVGAWGVSRLEPEAEAALAAELVRRHGFDFYIANAEMEYKYTGPDGAPAPEAFARSGRFAAAFRAAAPDVVAAVSSYGDASRADLDWAAWRRGGFDYLPQTYWNESEIYDPVACMEGAVRAGWPRDRVHPTIGIWGGGSRAYVSAPEYLARLDAAGATGFSVYLAESMPAGEWPAFVGRERSEPPPPPPPGDTCADECTRGGKRCIDGDLYQDCGDFDADACADWSEVFSCGTFYPGTTCSDGWCVGEPVDPPTCSDECTRGGKRCIDGDLYQDCGDFDADPCADWSPSYSCGTSWPGMWCRDGWCVGS